MSKTHHYEASVTWTGNTGTGTSSYRSYERAHLIEAGGKQPIEGSSDPAFRGDPARWNPEELLVASAAQCHMLSFLSLCAVEKVVVTAYSDSPTGTMVETPDGGGRFEEVVLHPRVTLADPGQAGLLPGLHERAHQLCFIANSLNFPVRHAPVTVD
ncbi:organic hydroperoxide reductase OsmC/OhrA [Streptosporangium album]|uniref:Organic hydroperoxide reductase OsmC/OhrA n=1 Tax=Streptosporangium album TaxID=47479 RepID=A0A7W7RZQ3_9ACTN|nr:OsmC family protein [Streptosporangium album]MBB4941239.1 organic hydroperoxide reductase OsmC/OhrA [Streptosporangium album]